MHAQRGPLERALLAEACTQLVFVNVRGDDAEIRFGIYDCRPKAAFEELSAALRSPITPLRVALGKMLDESRKVSFQGRRDEKMHVIVQQAKRVHRTMRLSLGDESHELSALVIVGENGPAVVAAKRDVVWDLWQNGASNACHGTGYRSRAARVV